MMLVRADIDTSLAQGAMEIPIDTKPPYILGYAHTDRQDISTTIAPLIALRRL